MSDSGPPEPPPGGGRSSAGGAWYAVAILMVAYTFSFIDRSILTLLVAPIRQDLGISDTQFSLLHGLAFAIFYTGLGIPIARLADRHSRKLIIAGRLSNPGNGIVFNPGIDCILFYYQ